MTAQDTLRAGERTVAHLAAIIVGFVLMAVGLGLGVTVIGLVFGIPIGLVGLGIFLWGLWSFGEQKKRRQT